MHRAKYQGVDEGLDPLWPQLDGPMIPAISCAAGWLAQGFDAVWLASLIDFDLATYHRL